MSFSDDGWGMGESKAAEVRDKPKVQVAETKATENVTKIEQEKVELRDEAPVAKSSVPENFSTEDTFNSTRDQVLSPANATCADSGDGWDSPFAKRSVRLPVVSEAAASRLPPATSRMATHTEESPPIDDTIDICSSREGTPEPPSEKPILPPQVKSSAASGKTFGTQNTASQMTKPTIPLSSEVNNGPPQKSFGTQNVPTADGRQAKPLTGFGGAFGAPKVTSTGFGSGIPNKTSEPSTKPVGFGGSFGETNTSSGFGGSKPTGFGGSKPTGFGGTKPSGFGGDKASDGVKETNESGGFHGATPSGFGLKKASGFGGANATEEKGESNTASGFHGATPSGFGAAKTSTGFGGVKPSSESSETKTSSGFHGATPSGFGAAKTSTGFGGVKPSSEPKETKTSSGFHGATPSGFGGAKTSTGFGGVKPSSESNETKTSGGFHGATPSGFGLKQTSGFGGAKPSDETAESNTFSGFHGATPSGFGGAKTSTGFGGPKPSSGSGETSTSGGFHGATPSGFGMKKMSGFGGAQTSSETGENSVRPSGFGGASKQNSGFGNSSARSTANVEKTSSSFGTSQGSTFGEDSQTTAKLSGFGASANKSSGFGGGNKMSGFGGSSNTQKSSGFGGGGFGAKKTEDNSQDSDAEPKTSSKPVNSTNTSSGFGNSSGFGKTSFSGFGAPADSNKKSFGKTESIANESGFSENATSRSTGFGKSRADTSGFGFGKTPNFDDSKFGSSGFGSVNVTNTSFGAFGNGFGGKTDGGFGESENKSTFNSFGGRNSFGGEQNSGCRNCGEEGHFARDCEKPRKAEVCRNCQKEGHFSKDCTEPRVPNGPCRNCGVEGHFSRDCTEPRVPNGPCRNCNVEGHFSRDCPQPKVPWGPCRNCNEEGHFAKDCTKERVRTEPTEPCRRCQEEGHWAYECPTRPRDLQGNILTPYEVQFRSETDMFEEAVNNDDRINFDQKVVASMGDAEFPDMATFEAFKVLPQEVHDNLRKMKMNRPTPIQRAAFFPILHGHNVVACAHTGSGKTLAFLIPLMINLLEDRTHNPSGQDPKPSPRCLIIAPTRELASQTFNTARQLAYETGLKCGLAYGGYSRSANLQHLQSFDQLGILVATMGRLQDFVDSNEVLLAKTKFIVLDEADRMVDGTDFGEDLTKLLGPPEDRQQQMILFSASFSENLQAEDLPKFVKEGYTMLQVDKFGTANEKIDQHIVEVVRSEKKPTLLKLLGIDENTFTVGENAPIETQKTLIFVNSVKFSDTLASDIANCGIPTISMHSHQNQEQRDRTLDDFRRGKYKCLVASNVCARGLNIAALDHVINYDMPDAKGFDEYVNRIGRTARAGFSGKSTAFIDPEADSEIIPSLVHVLTEAKKEVPEWLLNGNHQTENAEGGEDDEAW